MDPVTIGLMLFGAGSKIAGSIKANRAQAAADSANQAWYEEQANFARQATSRSVAIAEDDFEDFRSKQKSGFARGGVVMSGSPLLALMDTNMKAIREIDSIKENGRMQVKEAMLKAGASAENAARLTSSWNNVLPAVGTAIDTGVSLYKMKVRK